MKQWTLTAAVVIAALGFMTVMASAAQDPAPAPPAGAHGGGQTTDAPARAAVADNSAEPTPGDAGDAGDDHDGRRGKEPGRNQPPARRWAQEFESQYAQDLAWLRQRGLEKYADRLEAARKSDEAGNRMMVFSAHIRIRQLRRLWQERPEEAQRAVDEMRLGLHILDLAAEARKADGAEKQRLTQELEQALNRQFEARLAAQRSLLAAMERRLEELRQDISRQEELKSQIVQQRHSDLLNAEKPLPEPSLLMPGHMGHPAGGGPGGPGGPGDDESGGPGGPGGKGGPKPPPPPPQHRPAPATNN